MTERPAEVPRNQAESPKSAVSQKARADSRYDPHQEADDREEESARIRALEQAIMNGEAPAKRATSAELARGFGGTLVTREGTPRRMIARRQLTTTISEQRLAELRKLEAEALARTDQLGARARKPDADFDNYRSNLGTVVLNKLRARMQPAVVEPGQPYYIFGRDENGFLIGPTLNRDEAIGSIPGDSAVEWSSRTVILDEKGNLAGYVLSDGRIEPAHNNGGQGEKEARRGRLFPQSEIDLANVALLNIKGIINSGIANRQMNLANLLKLKKVSKNGFNNCPFFATPD